MKDLYDEDEILGEMKKEGFEKDEPDEKPVKKRVKKLRQKQIE